MGIKVNDAGTLKDVQRIFAKGNAGTLYEVNYALVNDGGVLTTVYSAVYNTSRNTNTTSSINTTFSTNNLTALSLIHI